MIHNICSSVSKKLNDRDWIESISLQKENYIPYINAFPWDKTSLSHGIPGLIILFSEMDDFFPNVGWDLAAHHCIVELVQEIEKRGIPNCSLFSGLTGVCFAIYLASKQGTRYRNLLQQFNHLLIKKIQTDYIKPIQTTINDKQSLSSFQYDVIAGISGVLSYILASLSFFPSNKEIALTLSELLIHLKNPVIYNGFQVPGWFSPPQYFIREEHRKLYPKGCFDTGIAHGISGCIAALSKASLCGIEGRDQKIAIKEMTEWLKKTELSNNQTWPSRYGFNSHNPQNLEIRSDFYRDGWCYGAPGIASSLYLASKVLNDTMLEKQAINIMISACQRFQIQPNLECVSLCHGLTGLLTMIHSMDIEHAVPIFSEIKNKIIDIVSNKYNFQVPFGFKCQASFPKGDETILIDNVGFLDGTIGTLLGLLSTLTNQPREWMKLLLIR